MELDGVLSHGTIPEQITAPTGEPFPGVLIPSSSASTSLPVLLEGIRRQKDEIQRLMHESGALLFRGFDVLTAADFNAVLEALGWEDFPYNGRGAHKKTIVGRVATANEKPLQYPIGFHNEMTFQLKTPAKAVFYCDVQPEAGGATPIVQGHVVYRRMEKELPEFLVKLESKGLSYIKVLCSDPSRSRADSWQAVFQASTKDEVEKKAKAQDSRIEWGEDGSAVSIMGPRVATKEDTLRGRKVWFNNIGSTYELIRFNPRDNGITFGDGTPLSVELMEACKKIMEEEKVAFRWRKGDVLILDNDAVLHAREPCLKPPRVILAALCAN